MLLNCEECEVCMCSSCCCLRMVRISEKECRTYHPAIILALSKDGQSFLRSLTRGDGVGSTCAHPGGILGWSEYFGSYALVAKVMHVSLQHVGKGCPVMPLNGSLSVMLPCPRYNDRFHGIVGKIFHLPEDYQSVMKTLQSKNLPTIQRNV